MEKINIAKLLKDCPNGMELDCTMYDNLYFNGVDTIGDIKCYIKSKDGYLTHVTFHENGCYNTISNAKCVIFPKGKTTWEGFHRPFNDGDIIYTKIRENINWLSIYKELEGSNIRTYVDIVLDNKMSCYCNLLTGNILCYKEEVTEQRLATEEEKQKLFQTINNNGYKWNTETKTLEKMVKPKFKVGDKIKHKTHIRRGDIVTEIKDTHYILNDEIALPFTFQDEYELIPNKFNINTLVPFESKVLVRDKESHKWRPATWGFYNEDGCDYHYIVIGGQIYRYCIPYDGNEHLLGTSDDCDSYYKNWEE